MTDPGYTPRHYSAAGIIGAARQSGTRPSLPSSAVPFARPERRELTDADRQAIAEALENGGQGLCSACGGIHVKPSTPACPRLATFEVDGDGRLKAGSFFSDGFWDTSRVQWPEDASEPAEGGTGG